MNKCRWLWESKVHDMTKCHNSHYNVVLVMNIRYSSEHTASKLIFVCFYNWNDDDRIKATIDRISISVLQILKVNGKIEFSKFRM